MPVTQRSPNSIPPAQTYTAFRISVAAGARRFAQTSWLRLAALAARRPVHFPFEMISSIVDGLLGRILIRT